MNPILQWAVAKILEKVTPEFYGRVTITFQAGQVALVETCQTEKPPIPG